MTFINPGDAFDQTTWLAVNGPGYLDGGYPSRDAVGTTRFGTRFLTVLPAWGLATSDLLYCARQFRRATPFRVNLMPLKKPWNYDTLFLSGPRQYRQPGQNDKKHHDLYVSWAKHSGEPLNNVVDLGLNGHWQTASSRNARGIMVGQVVVDARLQTQVTIIDCILPEEACRMDFTVGRVTFEGNNPPAKHHLKPLPPGVKRVIQLFEQHCRPGKTVDAPPYWETVQRDRAAQFKADSASCQGWLAASELIDRPWDIIAYTQAWGQDAGVSQQEATANLQMMQKLREHLPKKRVAALNAMWRVAEHLLFPCNKPRA